MTKIKDRNANGDGENHENDDYGKTSWSFEFLFYKNPVEYTILNMPMNSSASSK